MNQDIILSDVIYIKLYSDFQWFTIRLRSEPLRDGLRTADAIGGGSGADGRWRPWSVAGSGVQGRHPSDFAGFYHLASRRLQLRSRCVHGSRQIDLRRLSLHAAGSRFSREGKGEAQNRAVCRFARLAEKV